jgi:hypothetical protein
MCIMHSVLVPADCVFSHDINRLALTCAPYTRAVSIHAVCVIACHRHIEPPQWRGFRPDINVSHQGSVTALHSRDRFSYLSSNEEAARYPYLRVIGGYLACSDLQSVPSGPSFLFPIELNDSAGSILGVVACNKSFFRAELATKPRACVSASTV